MGLPVQAIRDALLQALRTHNVAVVSGDTGCGKTTQVGGLCCCSPCLSHYTLIHCLPAHKSVQSGASRVLPQLGYMPHQSTAGELR